MTSYVSVYDTAETKSLKKDYIKAENEVIEQIHGHMLTKEIMNNAIAELVGFQSIYSVKLVHDDVLIALDNIAHGLTYVQVEATRDGFALNVLDEDSNGYMRKSCRYADVTHVRHLPKFVY